MNGYSFCMITDGKEPEKTKQAIRYIHGLNVPNSEIIICGKPDGAWFVEPYPDYWEDFPVILLPRPELADAGRLGAMRNIACDRARYDKLAVVDDDIWFRYDWYQQMCHFGDDWDALSCKILNPDNTRFWDWKTYEAGINKLMDYDKTSPHVSITGGYICMKRRLFEAVRWDDERGFYQAEDVDYSERLKRAGFRIGINPRATVYHWANYTQRGDYVYRTEEGELDYMPKWETGA